MRVTAIDADGTQYIIETQNVKIETPEPVEVTAAPDPITRTQAYYFTEEIINGRN